MALTESQVLANEIERVLPKLSTLFDRDDEFYAWLEKRQVEKVSARDMRVPLEIRPGGNFGHFDADGGDLGLGDGPTFDKALVPTANLREAIQWTKKAEWATDDSRKAVLNTFRHLMAKGMAQFRRDVNALSMTAGNGVLGTVTTVTINTPAGFDTLTFTTDGFKAKLMRFGQTIQVYDVTLATNRGSKKITYYDGPGNTIRYVTGGVVAVVGDKIVVDGVTGASPVSLFGVPYHHAVTGTWLGLARSSNPEISGNRVNAAGSQITLPQARLAMNKMLDRVGQENGFEVTAWMHPNLVQAFEEMAQQVMVINKEGSSKQNFDLYFNKDNIRVAGAPVRTSYYWDRTRIDFLVKEAWGRAEMHPVSMYEVGDRKIFEIRGASGGVATSQIFYITASFQIFMNNPVAGAYIDNILYTGGL